MRRWGQKERGPISPLAYWSVGDDKTGGVALLLDPRRASEEEPWHPERWTKQVACLMIAGVLLVNIYAPTIYQEREKLFSQLKLWSWPSCAIVIAGDFNCVQSPVLDRLGTTRTGRSESATLSDLIGILGLADAKTLPALINEEEPPDPTDYFTYWTKSTASRIDRFYAP